MARNPLEVIRMDGSAIARDERQPKSAAVAGLVFGVILIVVLVLLQFATPSSVAAGTP